MKKTILEYNIWIVSQSGEHWWWCPSEKRWTTDLKEAKHYCTNFATFYRKNRAKKCIRKIPAGLKVIIEVNKIKRKVARYLYKEFEIIT